MATRKQLEQQFIEDRAFWGSVSARWRGLAGGVLIGAILGSGIGLAAAGTMALASGATFATMIPAALASEATLGIIGLFTGSGMLIGAGLWGLAGSISGAVASGIVANKELEQGKGRALDQEVSLKSPAPVSPFPPEKKPLLNWKVAGMAALLAGGIGAFLAASGILPTGIAYVMLGGKVGTAAGAAAAGLTFGVFGTVFGVGFQVWRGFKKWTDGFFEAKLSGRSAPALHELKEQLLATHPEREIAVSQDKAIADSIVRRAHADKLLEQRQNSPLQSPSL